METGGPTARPGEVSRRLSYAVTAMVCAGVLVIPYWVDRSFRRWWEGNRPLAPFGNRYRRMQAQYRARQDSLVENAVIVGAIAGVIAASMPPPRRPPHVASTD